jgi:monovalent cation/hydrogen antiporter
MSEALLLLIIVGAVGITAIARSKGIQAGLVIVVVAGAVSFIPGLERLELEPELILGLVMPPLLYSATQSFSFFSFVRYLRPIVGLGLGLVLVTAVAVTGLVNWLVPSIGFAGALVLAATVAPPDTVTTVTHGKELGLSKKVIAILTGESLVNDATALALFAYAVSLAAGTKAFIEQPVGLLAYGVGVGLLVGGILGNIASQVRQRISNPTLEAVVSLLVPFTAFLVAEQLHASGVLAVVMAGFSVAIASAYGDARTTTHEHTGHLTRLTEKSLWPVVDTLLESFVFAYIGLQLRFVIEELLETGDHVGSTLLAAGLVLLLVMVVRVVYVYLVFTRTAIGVKMRANQLERSNRARLRDAWERRERRNRGRRQRRPPIVLSWKERLLVSWTGMRGIVTLAAAAAIPATTAIGEDFPGRAEIQFIAFTVAIGTLIIQGATLPLLARSLKIDTTQEDQEQLDGVAAAEAAAVGDTPSERRHALAMAVVKREIDDEFARIVVERIDLQQAADEAARGEAGH